MCNFNQLTPEAKASLHLLMQKNTDSVGGLNFLLGLIEAMKEKKPNALMYKSCFIESNEVELRWNKIVFKDKLDILEALIRSEKAKEENFNILDEENDKKRKKILNMLKTLAPIEFSVTTKNSQNGEGFKFKIFENIKDGEANLNPIFVSMFFCSTEFIKKTLKYKI